MLPAVYRAEVGVSEATGRNDGPRVTAYLRYCGLVEGYEWCAAFVSWCHGQAGYAQPRNAWAAALFVADRTVWRVDNQWPVPWGSGPAMGPQTGPRAGDIFGIYVPAKRRIGHCGFIDGWDGKWITTVEGNVNHAVVRKRRLVTTIYAVARWTE